MTTTPKLKHHVDNLKSAVTLLRHVQIGGCTTGLYKRLDEIMYSIEDIIDELQPDEEPQPNLLLQAALDLNEQIETLAGESSVIDEDLENGQPLAALRAAIAKATGA